MQQSLTEVFFALLRLSLQGDAVPTSSKNKAIESKAFPFTEPLTAEQWEQLFVLSKKQALMGVIYRGVQRLPASLQPPQELKDKWSKVAIRIMANNSLMNGTAAKLTQIFAERGRRTVILKGQANALLYPEPLLRQAGDIDILVEGGRGSVLKLLKEMGVMEGVGIDEISNLHVHLSSTKFDESPTRKGISVEIHFVPTYNNSPFTTRAMCKFLAREISKPGAVNLSVGGFNCPPMTFALVMQLSHLSKHFYDEGIGLRQLADYHQLLIHSTEADRALVRKNLKNFGLHHIAGATMYVLSEIFKSPKDLMICEPDIRRGQQLYENILAGGNFGYYSQECKLPTTKRWLADRIRPFRRFSFNISESIWHELRYIITFMRYIPKRVKYRKISVKKV